MTVSFFNDLSVEQKQILENLLEKYPKGNKKAAAREALFHLLSSCKTSSHIQNVIKGIAYFYGVPQCSLFEMMRNDLGYAKAEETALYTIEVCSGLPCLLRGASDIVKSCEKWLGIPCEEKTIDKRFSLNKKECFNRCDKGPVVKINEDLREEISPTKIVFWLQSLSEEERKSPSVVHNSYRPLREDE